MKKIGIATCAFTLAVSSLTGCGGASPTPISPIGPEPPPPALTNAWTWISGSKANLSGLGATGNYGVLGTPAAANVPDSRGVATGWTDSSGNLWLFGGTGPDPTDKFVGQLNDLWKYSTTTQQWTWISGSNTINSPSVYGTQGVAAAPNTPGAREVAASWQDSAGNLWIFGGVGYNGASQTGLSQQGLLSDLWMYSPASNLWTWVAGSTSEFTPGVYGTLGTPDPQNAPGAREGSSYWTDAEGNFWMFGGYVQGQTDGSDSVVEADSNDMWEFNPKTSLWTWVGGSQMLTSPPAQPVYGVQGSASPTNNPGSRERASNWVDTKGNFWLFGGSGLNTSNQRINLNDLWEFVPSTGMWTWISGSSTPNAAGVYGTQGTPAPANSPGSRLSSASWTDSSGNLVLFGGFGLAASSTTGELGDLWSFNISTSQWTWLDGSSTVGAPATYGTLGTAATVNDPGGRDAPTAFPSSGGDLFLFGGYAGTAQNPDTTALNDLWKYTP